MNYEELPGVRWSHLKNMRVSPQFYKYMLDRPREDTAAMRIGRAVHTFILEPDTRSFAKRHPLFEGAVRRGKNWEEFCMDHDEAVHEDILIRSEYDRALGCAMAILAHPIAGKDFRGGLREHVIRWVDPTTSINCKARCDAVTNRLVELKTGADVSIREFPRVVSSMGYHGQLAYYLDGLRVNGFPHPEREEEPVLIAAQNVPPHEVVAWTVPRETLEIGQCLYKRLLQKLAECIDTNSWPGSDDGELQTLTLPAWALAEVEEPMPPLTIGGVALEV